MGWFLRKSIRFGPLRLNLSKRGLGASMGVKGLRAGVDTTGKPYVAGGRGGIYFRQRLPAGGRAPSPSKAAPTRNTSAWGAWIVVALVVLIALLLLAGRGGLG